jgi:hypothetical protein
VIRQEFQNVKKLLIVLVALLCAPVARVSAQGIMSDLLSGKLVNPQIGAYAWYNLKDNATGKEFFLRQAIVGMEKVNRKDAYWFETELVPRVGFPSVYKMLLTGPANDPKNVHRLLVREGEGEVQEVSLENGADWKQEEELSRKSVGVETLTFPGGDIQAEHYIVNDGEPGTEIWISEAVPPMGLVKMKNAEGELSLQRHGVGGKDGQSALPGTDASTAPSPDAAASPEAGDAPPEEVQPEAPKEKKKSNISPRKRDR